MNENVTLIPARRRAGNRIIKEEKPKHRVAAYCRVSTDSDEQAGSYEMQVNHIPMMVFLELTPRSVKASME